MVKASGKEFFFFKTHLDKYNTWIECRIETFFYLVVALYVFQPKNDEQVLMSGLFLSWIVVTHFLLDTVTVTITLWIHLNEIELCGGNGWTVWMKMTTKPNKCIGFKYVITNFTCNKWTDATAETLCTTKLSF